MMYINLWLGKYHILSALDSFSPVPHVFLAKHIKLQEYRIIKKISKDNPFFIQLAAEAEFLSSHSSNLIPKLYDVEEDRGNLYLIEEYIEGMNLLAYIRSRGCLKEEELLRFAAELFRFLAFLNTKEVSALYIDWKPENIIVAGTGLKIVDFGSAVTAEKKDTATALATEGFSAPELKSGGKLGVHTDIYGFGCILRYLADRTESGSMWFKCTIRRRLLKLSSRCTEAEPKERPHIRQVEKEIKKLLGKVRVDTVRRETLVNTGARLIGVCGNERGVGTTHIAVVIAKELADMGKKVAYVSVRRDNTEGCKIFPKRDKSADFSFFEGIFEDDIAHILNRGYDSVIVDFGKTEEELPLQLYGCDTKIVVVQNNIIKGGRIEKFLTDHCESINENGWLILVNLADNTETDEVKNLCRKIGIRADCKGIGEKKLKN